MKHMIRELRIPEVVEAVPAPVQDAAVRVVLANQRAGKFPQVSAYQMLEMLDLEAALRRVRGIDPPSSASEDGVQAA